MKYQTFTTKERMGLEEYGDAFMRSFSEILTKYYSPNKNAIDNESQLKYYSIEIPNTGGILLGEYFFYPQVYREIKCNHFIEYLGFRDTLKFNKMVKEIGTSLEDICYVHTGEIK